MEEKVHQLPEEVAVMGQVPCWVEKTHVNVVWMMQFMAKFDGTSTWDELQCSINPHIANFNNEFRRNFDDEHTMHEITLTMWTLPKTCSPALTERLSQWLQSLSYEATNRLTALEHNNVPWMARPVIRPHIGQSWCDSTSGQLTPRWTLRDRQCVQDEGNRTTTRFSIAHIKEPNTTHYTAFENKAIRGTSAFGVHSLG